MKNILYIFAAAMLFGCMHDPVVDSPVVDPVPAGDEGTHEVLIEMAVPGGISESAGSATRAITANEENTISTIDVLAFRIDGTNETFAYSTQGTLVAGNTAGAETQSFTAKLHVQTYQQRFVVILNASQQVRAVLSRSNWVGVAKATVLSALRYDFASGTDRWNATSPSGYTPLPMWGESAAETVTAGTRNLSQTIYVMRMLARIDVKLDTTVAGLTNQFKFKSVDLYNFNSGGRIVPDAPKVVSEQRNGQPYYYVNATTIPTDLQFYSARRRGPARYTDFSAPGTTDVAMIGAIYVFEAAAATAASEATSLIIGGLYGTDTTPTYYRIDIHAAGSTARLDLLRNHQYVVNITAVRARGHATPEEAFASTSVNMTANILVWNQPGMSNVVFDGQNILASNKDQVNLFSNQYTNALTTGENTVQITTDVPAGWTVSGITNADGTGSPAWVRVSPTQGPGGNVTTQMTVSADANTTGADRTAIVTLSAGRLRLPIRVNQSTRAAIALNIVAGSPAQEVQEIVFNTAVAGTPPITQSFTVNWLPASNPVRVVANQVGRYDFPNPGSNPAENNNAPYTDMPWPETTGTKSFNVSPGALSASDLASDPFFEKSSRFDMTVNNGQTTMTKSITLRLLQYNLRVEQAPGVTQNTSPANPMEAPWYAQLGGRRFTYNVRSNSSWRISSISETHLSSYNNNGSFFASNPTAGDNVSVNATGQANYTPGGGTKELFTTTNSRRGESGYADITYSSDPAGRFTNVVQRIFFPSAQFTVYGIVKMGDSNANFYNIFAGSNKTNSTSTRPQHMHPVFNDARNFGTNLNGSGNTATPSSYIFTGPVNMNGVNYNDSSNLTVTDINDAVSANADMLYISGSTKFGDDVAQAIVDNFLRKDKPVLIAIEDGDSFVRLWSKVGGGGQMIWKSNSALNGNAPVYQFQNQSNDPIINGPFKVNGSSLANQYWGCDGSGSIAYWFTDSSGSNHTTTNMVVYSNARNQSGNTDSPPQGPGFSNQTMDNGYTCFRFTHVPLIFAADGGFAGCFNQTDTDRGPALINTSTNYPALRTGYGGGGTKRDSANSYFIANVIAWAVQRRSTQ